MGYTTEFENGFELDRPLDAETMQFLKNLNQTRRMGRDTDKLKELGYAGEYGEEGEFFVETREGDIFGQDTALESVIDYNKPPITQPSLWCQWVPSDDGQLIVWDYGEKFYCYVEWLKYIIDKVLKPKNYILNGNVQYRGEEFCDFGTIQVTNNQVQVYEQIYLDDEPISVNKKEYKELQEFKDETIFRLTDEDFRIVCEEKSLNDDEIEAIICKATSRFDVPYNYISNFIDIYM